MGPKYEQKHTFLPSVTSRTFSCSSAVCRDCWSGDRMADKLSTRACFKERFLSSTAAMLNWTKFCSVAHARNLARNLLKNICDIDRWQESFSEMIAKKKKWSKFLSGHSCQSQFAYLSDGSAEISSNEKIWYIRELKLRSSRKNQKCNQVRSLWVGACNSLIFLSRRFHRPIYF